MLDGLLFMQSFINSNMSIVSVTSEVVIPEEMDSINAGFIDSNLPVNPSIVDELKKEDHEIMHNRISDETAHQKSNRHAFEKLPQVYQVIESWSYNDSKNSSKFPILSSIGGNQRPRYTRNEIFKWNDIPIDNINDVLETLDKEEHNGSVSDFGEFGKAVNLPQELIKQSKAKMSLHQLDVVASDIMSLNRKINDMRNSRLLFNFCIE